MTFQEMTTEPQAKKKPRVALMNVVHDLPVLVARDEGFFKDEGLDIEFVATPGMAQVTTSHSVKFDSVFDRPLDSTYNNGGVDQYRMCEWGIMKRAVEAECGGLRARKIVALGASMSAFAIVVAGDSNVYEPEMLKDKAVAVTPNNGSHFTTLKMLEGFLTPEHIKTTSAGSMPRSRAAAKCWTDTSASVQWVAIRATDAPASRASRRSSTVPTPGSSSTAIRAARASSTAARISEISSTSEKP